MNALENQEALAAANTQRPGTTGSGHCNCFDNVNAALKEHGAMLNMNLRDAIPRAFVHVIDNGQKRKRGAKIPLMQASYCPFCGSKYALAKATGAIS